MLISKVTGHYGGLEDSYLVMVHEADREHIKQLGEKYHQDLPYRHPKQMYVREK
jgi:hypothetical protein